MKIKMLRGALTFVLVFTSLSIIDIPIAHAATVYTFTNAGATGYQGPTQAQVSSAYTSTTLAGAVTINTQGIQEWTVPSSGRYSIKVSGASGGLTSGYPTTGYGAIIQGEFTLTQGTVLKIAVGQKGVAASSSSYGGGGGGGSFVVQNSTLIIAAGGGGSHGTGGGNGGVASFVRTHADASLTTTGKSGNTYVETGGAGGTNGSEGGTSASSWNGYPGAGYLGNAGTGGAKNWANAMLGGNLSSYGYGGFGGGGSGGMYGGSGGGGYSGGGANSRHGPGGGGASFNSGSNASAVLATSFTDGQVQITTLGPSVTTFASTSTLINSTTIDYNITFSEAVTGLTSGDFSKSGTGSSSCTIASPSGSGTSYAIQLTGCSEGTVILTMAANAVSNTSSQTAPSSNTVAATVTIDRTAPTVTSVAAPANSTYFPANTPTFTVIFSESVTVTGTPRLTLTVGSTTKYANYLSMSDSKTALFQYTVASNTSEFDTDGIAVATSLDLNGGAIADLATNTLTNTSFTAPTLTSVLVAQPAAAPTIDSVTATNATLTIYFTPGAARGSTTSTYHYSTDNGSTYKVRSSGTTASPLVITTVSSSASSLVNGTGYQIRLKAISSAGNSDASNAMTETPTAISVSGDSTLILTYGNSASTSAYSATGGTGTYTWSLGSSISGVTLSGTTVTASNSLAAGTYSQTVRATDGNSQVGTKSLTITVNKAATSISIALPNNATSAAASGTITITATVPRAGSVNFQLGGTTISGCGSAVAASTSATCLWTAPGSLGSVTLAAIFTPTDASNYESSTSTNLVITIVNGVSTVTLSLAGGVTQTPKGQPITITAAIDQEGRVTFTVDGKKIPGCINRRGSAGNVTCSWKPAVQKLVTIKAALTPTNNIYQASTQSVKVQVTKRTGLR